MILAIISLALGIGSHGAQQGVGDTTLEVEKTTENREEKTKSMVSAQRRVLVALVAMLVPATFLLGCGRGTVAKVNGRKITRQEYYNRLERLQYRHPVTGQPMEAGAWVLDRLINEELILRLAEQEKVPPTEEQVKKRMELAQKQPNFAATLKAAGVTRDQFKEMMRIEQAAFNLQTKGVKVTDEEVRAFYEANKHKPPLTTPDQAYVAAIFCDKEADIKKAESMLKRGVDFGTVARTLSLDKASAKRDGRLNRPITRGDQFPPKAVQDIVFNTRINGYTKPIYDGQSGWVIFKVLQIRKQRTEKLKDVEYAIWEQLMLQKGLQKNAQTVEQDLNNLRQKAKIEIGIERYKNLLLPQPVEQTSEKTEK